MAKKKKERDPEVEAVGRRARLVRLERHMTLEQVAEAAETSVQFLSQVEKGEQSMTMIKFGKLATALRVSSDYLLYGRERLHAAEGGLCGGGPAGPEQDGQRSQKRGAAGQGGPQGG